VGTAGVAAGRSGGRGKAAWRLGAVAMVAAASVLLGPGTSQAAWQGLQASWDGPALQRAAGLALFFLCVPLAAGEVIGGRLPAAASLPVRAALPLLVWAGAAGWWRLWWRLSHWTITGRPRLPGGTLLDVVAMPWAVPAEGRAFGHGALSAAQARWWLRMRRSRLRGLHTWLWGARRWWPS